MSTGVRAPRRPRSADAALGAPEFRGQGPIIDLDDSDSDAQPNAANARLPRRSASPDAHADDAVCFSDQCDLRGGAWGSESGSEAADAQGSGEGSADEEAQLEARRERRRHMTEALRALLRSESPEHMYWSDAGEPHESDIADDEQAAQHDAAQAAAARRCAFADDAAGSDGDADDEMDDINPADDAMPAPHIVDDRSAQQHTELAARGAKHGKAQARNERRTSVHSEPLRRSKSRESAKHPSAAAAMQVDAAGAAALFDKDDAELMDMPGSCSPPAHRVLDDDADSEGPPLAHHQHQSPPNSHTASENESPMSPHGQTQPRQRQLTGIARRQQQWEHKRQRELAEAQRDPEAFRRMNAVPKTLRVFGWDQCALQHALTASQLVFLSTRLAVQSFEDQRSS